MLIKTNSKKQTYLTQSAGNLLGSSETTRKLSDEMKDWAAGIIDGDGNFDVQNINSQKVLKQIRITQHPRDARILYKIKELFGGRIRLKGNKYILWSISTKVEMRFCLQSLTGRIRLKVPQYKQACLLYNIVYKDPNYIVPANSAYFAGLVDTDGTVVFNYTSHRIELHLEFQKNEYSLALKFDNVITNLQPLKYTLVKRNQTRLKEFYSVRFSFNRVSDMLPLYNYFLKHRLYSDFKYYRIMQIKRFLELRPFKNYPQDSLQFQSYIKFLKNFHQHLNEHKPLPIYLQRQMMI